MLTALDGGHGNLVNLAVGDGHGPGIILKNSFYLPVGRINVVGHKVDGELFTRLVLNDD